MKIAIIGLGYVGIQLALALGEKYQVVGFDLDHSKIESYKNVISKLNLRK